MDATEAATIVASVLWGLHSATITVITTKYMLRSQNLQDAGSGAHTEIPIWAPVRSNALFTDPQSVTINAVATPVPKTSVNGSTSVYSSSDGNVVMTISHIRGKRKRSVVRIDQKKVATDPLLVDRSVETSQAVYIVLNAPINGVFSNAEQKYLLDALTLFMTTGSGAAATKFVAGES